MDEQENICTHRHEPPYLNKRLEDGFILAFCNHCPFTDEVYTQLQLTAEKTRRLEDFNAILRYIDATDPSQRRKTPSKQMIIKRYYEDECLASQDDERPYTFYLLMRVYKTWITKKGVHREKWERTVIHVTGRTKSEAERKLKRMLERRKLEPFNIIRHSRVV